MTLSQVLAVLRARWLSALLVFAVVVGVVVGITLSLPKRYGATATVLIDFKNPDPISGQSYGGVAPTSYMVTQVDIIRSGRVARRVIDELRLSQNEALRSQWLAATEGRGEFEAWLTDLLRRNLEVRPTRDSGALDVTYLSGDPRFSATLANAFAQAFIDINLELRTEPAKQFSGFFDSRAKLARDALEAAQTRLSDYQRQRGLLVTDERFDIETARLQELSTQVVMLQALAAESAGRSALAGSSGDRAPEVVANPLVSQLTADLSRQQARLQELTSRLGDANPQVVEARASIDELRRRINTESARVTGSLGVSNSVNQGRLSQVQAALTEQRAKVLRLKEQRDEAAVLERDVESAKLAYQQVLQRLSQTGLESQTTQSNVSFLERATEPLAPSSPRTMLNAAISVVLGLVLALAVALIREWRDRRLRTDGDIDELLQVPLLGVLPRATPKALAREANPGLVLRPGGARP